MEQRIVVIRFFGVVREEILASAVRRMKSTPGYSKNFLGITDLRHSKVEINPTQLRHFFTENIKDKESTQRWVYLVAKPKETALAILYANLFNNSYRKCFSTVTEASKFLGADLEPFLTQTPLPDEKMLS